MRISDWSSDVCSSDLRAGRRDRGDQIMTTRKPRTGFASRPGAADAWIAGPEGAEAPTAPSPPVNSARLTIAVKPQLRQRLKTAAPQTGAPGDGMLRTLLTRQYTDGEDNTK